MWSKSLEVLNPYEAICEASARDREIQEREIQEQRSKVKEFWSSMFGFFGIR